MQLFFFVYIPSNHHAYGDFGHIQQSMRIGKKLLDNIDNIIESFCKLIVSNIDFPVGYTIKDNHPKLMNKKFSRIILTST